MANQLIVLAFEGTGTAEAVLNNLEKLQEDGAVDIQDVVVAARPEPASGFKPSGRVGDEAAVSAGALFAQPAELKISRPKEFRKRYGSKGAGAGFLAGLLLGGPIGAAVVGGAAGGVYGRMHKYGIDEKFVKETAAAIPAGSSALFLYGTAADRERLLDELRPFGPRILTTTISDEQEQEVRKSLSE